jgi:hypothetical protein
LAARLILLYLITIFILGSCLIPRFLALFSRLPLLIGTIFFLRRLVVDGLLEEVQGGGWRRGWVEARGELP